MAKQYTSVEEAYLDLVKIMRSQIRLRHSVLADRELRRKLPALELEFQKAVKAGTEYEFVLSEISRVSDAVA